VWEPAGDGPFPVVYALPGSGNSAERDLDVFATEVASRGVLVFGTDITPARARNDTECGYRYVVDAADQYGGDINQPVTMIGYSVGATMALVHGLGEASFGPDSNLDVGCPPGVERPDVIVSINGPHVSTSQVEERVVYWGNTKAEICLIAAENDGVVGSHESVTAHELLADAGYSAEYIEIPNANHWEPVFHDMAYGNYSTLDSDHPAGQATVQATLDAIGITTEATD
jgi:acetyl esterase/lipase